MRSTWAVMLVHGVGDTDPGATLSAFLPRFLKGRALRESASPQNRLLVEPAPHLPPEHPLPPPAAADETPIALADRFPMHLRTFEITGADGGKPSQAVFAEVFWADLSRAGQSQWEVLKRTISLVFDLRHISNVAAAYGGLRLASGLRLILHFISWLLCGPIAGLTAFILALLVARYSVVYFYGPASDLPQSVKEIAVALFGLVAAAAVLVWRKRSALVDDETWSLFANWILAGGIISVLIGLCRLAFETFPWNTGAGRFLESRLLLGQIFDASPGVTVTHVLVVLGLGYAAFVLLALTVVAAFAVWFLARGEARRRGEKAAVPALDAALGASMLQVMLWVIIGTALGSFVLFRFLPQYKSVLQTVVTGLTLKLGVAAVVVLCAALVWAWRRTRIKDDPAKQGELPRLLVNTLIMTALIWLTLASMLLFAEAFLTGNAKLHDMLQPSRPFVQGLTIAAVIVLPFFWQTVRNTLHIVLDVTNHFYRKRLNSGRGEVEPGDFSIQQKIEGRFRRVLQELLQAGNVTHLTVVAHSQGTVIALDVLWLAWANNLLAGKTVRLVTMGSPFSHLYQHYFPHRYPPLFVNGELNRDSWGPYLNRTIQEWINIYRVDDYIGTWVCGNKSGDFPRNNQLGPGGHTGYWSDDKALGLMARSLPG